MVPGLDWMSFDELKLDSGNTHIATDAGLCFWDRLQKKYLDEQIPCTIERKRAQLPSTERGGTAPTSKTRQ